jgi:carboxyl-terminal processing protease
VAEPGPPRAGTKPSTLFARLALAVAFVATFGAGLGAGQMVLLRASGAGASSSMVDHPAFRTFQTAWNLIHERYVDEGAIDEEAMIYGATEGMVDALGDTGHSRFLPPELASLYIDALRGEFIGIGLELDHSLEQPVVIAPIDGSPADEAGVRSRDVLLEVNGKPTRGMAPTELFTELRGEEGTTVELTFERPEEDREYTVTLERRRIEIDPVTWAMLPEHVALIRIADFSRHAAVELRRALEAVAGQGATAIVLDLRDNPGGYTDVARAVASEFLDEGVTIYQTRNRDGETTTIDALGGGRATDIPVVVLINGGSASAAEIVASALRDNGRAELVGEATFGTGTQLSPIGLDDGSILVLGTELWLTAGGEQAWHVGIEPTIEVELPGTSDPLRPEEGTEIAPAELDASDDTQLDRAVALLQS